MNSKFNLKRVVVFVFCFSLFSFHCYGQMYESLFDPTVDKHTVGIQRVAIIPNRLPLTLAEPEKWRRYNWELISNEFAQRGFEVVDYETTLEAVRGSALPLDDTGSSEEKFNTSARKLNADILIMPYYGTGFDMKSFVVINKPTYLSSVSLQIYSSKHNKFFYRGDSAGKSTYIVGLGYAIGMGIMLLGGQEGTSLGMLVMTVGNIVDLVQTLIPAEVRYKSAFKQAVNTNLAPFFATYSAPEKYTYCGQCGARNSNTAPFCGKCGHKLR